MSGLNLQTFLTLIRADLALWTGLATLLVAIVLVSWTTWGSRRVLRKCLVVSLVIHLGMIATGGQTPWVLRALGLGSLSRTLDREGGREHVRSIRITPDRSVEVEGNQPSAFLVDVQQADTDQTGRAAATPSDFDRPGRSPETPQARHIPQLDRPEVGETAYPATDVAARDALGLDAPLPDLDLTADTPPREPPFIEDMGSIESAPDRLVQTDPDDGDFPALSSPRPIERAADVDALEPLRRNPPTARSARESNSTDFALPPGVGRTAAEPSPRPLVTSLPPITALPVPSTVTPGDGTFAPRGEPSPASGSDEPVIAATADPTALEEDFGVTITRPRPSVTPTLTMPDRLPGDSARPRQADRRAAEFTRPITRPPERPPIEVAGRIPPLGYPSLASSTALPSPRRLPDVPEVYRPRLDPDRFSRAQEAGASRDSEEAVERALDWLARHQDADGRWDAATETDASGSPLVGADDFTIHCPPGELCSGSCYYWEADTATTGLALLAYLGAGYTHREGEHAQTVANGLRFLLSIQKADGDLRDRSRAVGMYCHAMATLALSEAYALTGDPALADPARRAVDFLLNSRAADKMSWRYAPGAPTGDTSILGWVILVLKSAEANGFEVPTTARDGAARWLRLVSSGSSGGLAGYQPGREPTPTMTAEAWVCRQFLGLDQSQAAAEESARHLLENGPVQGEFNLYYWYYGTLSMYQHGGASWMEWNRTVRDRLVTSQERSGHQAGSWNPAKCEGKYDSLGGRVYSTALATLTLEVYYRYLRLETSPDRPSILAPRIEEGVPDSAFRRARAEPPSAATSLPSADRSTP